jgi:hypothetical protein
MNIEQPWNDTDRVKPKNPEKSLSTTNPTELTWREVEPPKNPFHHPLT